MPNPDVIAYLNANRDKHLQQLCRLLRFASIANNDDDQCPRCAEWLVAHLASLGLAARIMATEGKDAVFAESDPDPAKPTLLIYGHYDVQPPDPLDQWDTDPFEPATRDGQLFARGASDDKGQLFLHLMALEAHLACGGLPVNVKILLEGEEEIGSPSLESFVSRNKALLAADAALISDSAFFAEGIPSILTGLRGLAYVELTVRGPGADVHSGLYGGVLRNPINALARILADMHDDAGRVTIPGFYNDVLPLSDAERAAWASLPFDAAGMAAAVGVDELAGGEQVLPPLERCWARPTLDVNGIVGGYTQPGAKTIIPSEATAKISMRLVADQDPERIVDGVRQFVAEHTPPGVDAAVSLHSTGRPVRLNTDSPAIQAARAAMTEAFGPETIVIGCGASVPVTELFQRLLGLDAAMMGFGLPDDNLHSPNEKFSLDQFYKGSVASAAFLEFLPKQLQ